MPRKSNPSKKTTTEKKHTAIPPVAKPEATKPVAATTPAKEQTPVIAPAVTAVAPHVLKELVSPSATDRAKAATAIGKAQDASAVQPLLTALQDSDADVAREAATALGLLGNPSAVQPLIDVIVNANGYYHSVVRSAAAASLGKLKDARAFEALVNAVYDPIADSSSEAISALAALGNAKAVGVLIEVVRNRNGFFVNSVRRSAVLGLIKLGGEEAQSELRFVSSDGWEDSVIREEATAALRSH